MNTNDQTLLDTLKDAIDTRQRALASKTEHTEEELLGMFNSELAVLEILKEAEYSDDTLATDVNALRIAVKAVAETKRALVAGGSLEAADLAAVITANDVEQEIVDKYFGK